MEAQVPILNAQQPDKKVNSFEVVSDKMTTAIACASGGAVFGTTFGGPIGGTIGAAVTGIAGFLISGSHHSRHHDK